MVSKLVLMILCLAILVLGLIGCSETGSSVNTGSGTMNWLVDWNAALEKAKQMDKPILINFYTDACPACRLMDQTTFTDEGLIDFLNANFINVKNNAGKTTLYMNYGINAVPTFIFSTPDGYNMESVITKSVGYRNADEFYILAQAVLNTWQS